MKKFLIILAVLSASSSNAVFAKPSCNGVTACSGSAKELIHTLSPYGGNGYKQLIIKSPFVVSRLNCVGAAGGKNLVIYDSNPAFREIYALLLTASISNSKIMLRIDETKRKCTLRDARLIN